MEDEQEIQDRLHAYRQAFIDVQKRFHRIMYRAIIDKVSGTAKEQPHVAELDKAILIAHVEEAVDFSNHCKILATKHDHEAELKITDAIKDISYEDKERKKKDFRDSLAKAEQECKKYEESALRKTNKISPLLTDQMKQQLNDFTSIAIKMKNTQSLEDLNKLRDHYLNQTAHLSMLTDQEEKKFEEQKTLKLTGLNGAFSNH